MGNNSGEQYFPRATHSRSRNLDHLSGRHSTSRARRPSGAGYLVVAIAVAATFFFGVWWMLVTSGDEAPWIPAGLASSIVLLIALFAREAVMRRAWTRYLLEQGVAEGNRSDTGKDSSSQKASVSFSAWLRTLQQQSAVADRAGSTPETHLDVFNRCQNYLAAVNEMLQTNDLHSEKRASLRAGQERARVLQKHHMLTWAKDCSRSLTHDAQQRARMSDRIETANRALACLDTALNAYPNETELNESKIAIREFIASVKVAHWVELAERSAFKGHYRRAINRYQDALFYLTRETLNDEVRQKGTEGIQREIQNLRDRLASRDREGAPNQP